MLIRFLNICMAIQWDNLMQAFSHQQNQITGNHKLEYLVESDKFNRLRRRRAAISYPPPPAINLLFVVCCRNEFINQVFPLLHQRFIHAHDTIIRYIVYYNTASPYPTIIPYMYIPNDGSPGSDIDIISNNRKSGISRIRYCIGTYGNVLKYGTPRTYLCIY